MHETALEGGQSHHLQATFRQISRTRQHTVVLPPPCSKSRAERRQFLRATYDSVFDSPVVFGGASFSTLLARSWDSVGFFEYIGFKKGLYTARDRGHDNRGCGRVAQPRHFWAAVGVARESHASGDCCCSPHGLPRPRPVGNDRVGLIRTYLVQSKRRDSNLHIAHDHLAGYNETHACSVFPYTTMV